MGAIALKIILQRCLLPNSFFGLLIGGCIPSNNRKLHQIGNYILKNCDYTKIGGLCTLQHFANSFDLIILQETKQNKKKERYGCEIKYSNKGSLFL